MMMVLLAIVGGFMLTRAAHVRRIELAESDFARWIRRPGAVALGLNALPANYTPRPLSPFERAMLAPYIPKVDLDAVLVQCGYFPPIADPAILANADGLTTDAKTIYFKRLWSFEYLQQLSLLAHELVHAGQFRRGEIVGWNAAGQPKNYEQAAYAMGDRVRNELGAKARAWVLEQDGNAAIGPPA